MCTAGAQCQLLTRPVGTGVKLVPATGVGTPACGASGWSEWGSTAGALWIWGGEVLQTLSLGTPSWVTIDASCWSQTRGMAPLAVCCQLPGSVGSQCQLLEPLWVFNYPSWGRSSVCSQPAYGGTGRTKVSAGLSISGWSRAMGHSLAAGRIYLMLGENRGKQWRLLWFIFFFVS